jgi:type IV pilus assembly protein PilV
MSPTKQPAERRSQRGYTVVEVMMALAVLAVGGAGVLAMQRATLLGNVRSRNLATANAVAATWAERLRADAATWTDADGLPNVTATNWLSVVGTDFPNVLPDEGQWIRPDPVVELGISPMANVQGHDTLVGADAAFCTHVRLTQLMPTTIRAEIRVFWLRNQGGGTLSGSELCPDEDDDPAYVAGVGSARERYHFVYLTTAVMRSNP